MRRSGVRPDGTLGEVLRRLVAALESEPGTGCPVCGEQELRWAAHGPGQRRGPRAGHRTWEGAWAWDGPVCAGCGIVVPRPALADAVSLADPASAGAA